MEHPELSMSMFASREDYERARFDQWASENPLAGHTGALLKAFRELQWQGWRARAEADVTL
jgi:hypothetical protein